VSPGNVGVAFDVLSYAGLLTVALLAAPDIITDLDALADSLTVAYAHQLIRTHTWVVGSELAAEAQQHCAGPGNRRLWLRPQTRVKPPPRSHGRTRSRHLPRVPQPLTDGTVHAADMVISMDCSDSCPILRRQTTSARSAPAWPRKTK